MYKKIIKKLIVSILLISFCYPLKADEGMWLPFKISQQKYLEMKRMGLKVPLDSIFNLKSPSLKDAIVSLNHGSCTGSFISKQGLLLTNHHCIIDDVQYHSSVSNNYLEKGYWSRSLADELPLPGKTASILLNTIDVTDIIINQLPTGANEQIRTFLIDSISNSIITQQELGLNIKAEINQFYEGSMFIMFISEVFEDVRLVASPPSSMGQFGKDDDNWMWPRHSSDFALLRVYMGPDGKPAPFNSQNVPYKPVKSLVINEGGIVHNDFTMVMGYPGRTQRFISSYAIEEIEQIINPVIIDVKGLRQSIWDSEMKKDDNLKIKYSSNYAESSNHWKYAIGQNLAIKNNNLIEKRGEFEHIFLNWIKENNNTNEEYKDILPSLAMIHSHRKSLVKVATITMETLITNSGMFLMALEALYYKSMLEENIHDTQLTISLTNDFNSVVTEMFKNSSPGLDKKVFVAMLDYYLKNIPDSLRPTDKELFGSGKINSSDDLATHIYSRSVLTNIDRFNQFIANPCLDKLNNDPALQFASTIMAHFAESYFILEEFDSQIGYLMRKYISGLKEMNSCSEFYPDANSTLRISYGTVQPYNPQDGIYFKYYTTTKGVLQKISSSDLYTIPSDYLDLLTNKEFGKYAQADGQVPVCFISNNDITGGNSGSPVLNGNGELVGVAFDGNWEGMTSDLEYNHELQRCINVDIRHILFILDKYAKVTHLVNELTVISN